MLMLAGHLLSQANDSAFYAEGNQLIPLQETQISVEKEVLRLKRTQHDFMHVRVSYEFMNPGEAKEMRVGFEASVPQGDVDPSPVAGRHPYMRDFKVKMNGEILPYDVQLVKLNGDAVVLREEESDENEPPEWDRYVYHFKGSFQPGVNRIEHEYLFQLSSSVMDQYSFPYILTAANRWAGGRIGDFKLQVDLGSSCYYQIEKTFFDGVKDWVLVGKGKIEERVEGDKSVVGVSMDRGYIEFHQKNFTPRGEIQITSPHLRLFGASDEEGKELNMALFEKVIERDFSHLSEDLKLKILRNLPYAWRGYRFDHPELAAFYENEVPWYQPKDGIDVGTMKLTDEEKSFIHQFKKD